MSSVRTMADISGFSRDAITKRQRFWNLGDDFKLKDVCDLKPLDERQANKMSLEEARTEDTQAATELKRIQIAEAEGRLVDVDEILTAESKLFETIAAIIKRSRMSSSEKEDCYDAIREAAVAPED